MAELLKTEEDVANCLRLVLDDDDVGECTHALSAVARDCRMSAVAEYSGPGPGSAVQGAAPSSQPRFDTIYRFCHALGVRLVAQPAAAHI